VASTNGLATSHEHSVGSLYLELNADTTKLARKLRAIAKHLAALADELEAIDSEDEQKGEHVLGQTTCRCRCALSGR